MDVRYRDMNGDQPERTEATARYHSTGWALEVKLFHGEEISPYATLPGSKRHGRCWQATETDEALPITPKKG